MSKYRLVLSALFLLISPAIVWAVTNTASTSGAWETGANWSLGHAPLATEDVVIPPGLSMTINASDVCLSLTINAGGTVTIIGAQNLSIAGAFSNTGTFTAANVGSTITFNAAVNSIVSGTGVYTIAGTIVLDMGAVTTALDVQSSNFCASLSGSFVLTQGTWRMDNPGTLGNLYTGGNPATLTIPNTVVIESDLGQMNMCNNANVEGNCLLEGELFMNGGRVYVCVLEGYNAGIDFQYRVVGGISPVLKIVSGTLFVFAGFNPFSAADYINFNMSGGTMYLAYSVGVLYGGASNEATFHLQDVVGGQTVMSGGTIVLQDADNSATDNDLDMGGANVAATNYSVTGGYIQFGYINTQATNSFFGVTPNPTTNYPNWDFEAGAAKTAAPYFSGNTINIMSVHINPNMTLDCSGYNNNVNITNSSGTYAFDMQGTFLPGTGTYTFNGPVNQLITANIPALFFENLVVANTLGAITTMGGASLNTITTNSFTVNSGFAIPGTLTTLDVGNTILNGGSFTAPSIINQTINWTNNGGIFVPGVNTVNFLGTAAQAIGGSSSTTFYDMVINNSSAMTIGVTQNIATTVSNNLTLTNGAYFLSGNTLTINNPSNTAITGGSPTTYIVSENTSMSSMLTWHNISQTLASYNFPFGATIGGTPFYLPFIFNITTAAGTLGDVSLATYDTPNTNLPFAPSVTNLNGATPSCYMNLNEGVQAIVDRWWQITAPSKPTATITFTYAGPEGATVTGNPGCGSTLDAYDWNGSVWQPPVGNQALIVTGALATGTVQATGINNFTEWVLGLFASPLPITLLDFTAAYDNTENDVNLYWSTASETNNKLFTIERTLDGNTFTEIATVPGAGNSDKTLNYSTIDPYPIPGIDYYRLKQTDYDGNFSYSSLVPVNVTSNLQLTLFPNPATSNMMLSCYTTAPCAMDLRILDLAGQQITTYSASMLQGDNTYTIDVSSLAKGVYFLQSVTEGQSVVKKFVKQ